jgi:hypothetical protein
VVAVSLSFPHFAALNAGYVLMQTYPF